MNIIISVVLAAAVYLSRVTSLQVAWLEDAWRIGQTDVLNPGAGLINHKGGGLHDKAKEN